VGGNATRLLRRMGLLEELEAVATVPTELVYRQWRTGSRVAGSIMLPPAGPCHAV
jgi:hypothetical protein